MTRLQPQTEMVDHSTSTATTATRWQQQKVK